MVVGLEERKQKGFYAEIVSARLGEQLDCVREAEEECKTHPSL